MDLAALSAWRRHLLAGDLLVIGAGLAATVASFLLLWQGDRPERAIVRAGGAIVAELPLDAPRSLTVAGPLGETRIARGRYAMTVHRGSYAGLGDTWARLMGRWLPASGERVGDGVSFEKYRNTPDQVPDEQLETELYVPLAPSTG